MVSSATTHFYQKRPTNELVYNCKFWCVLKVFFFFSCSSVYGSFADFYLNLRMGFDVVILWGVLYMPTMGCVFAEYTIILYRIVHSDGEWIFLCWNFVKRKNFSSKICLQILMHEKILVLDLSRM